MYILKEDDTVRVTLENDGSVKKVVLSPKWSGFKVVSAEEAVTREIRALGMLQEIEGVQRYLSREAENTLYTSFIHGTKMSRAVGLGHNYFDHLKHIVDNCQQQGVYRTGMSKTDFLVVQGNIPYIVDFGNVLFHDDPLAKIPGVVGIARMYSSVRLHDLRKRYGLSSLREPMRETAEY